MQEKKPALRSLFYIFLYLSICHPLFAHYEGLPEFEPKENSLLDIIANYIPNDPLIFEAGGREGTDTIRFALKWPQAQIITFEPVPYSFDLLQKATSWLPNVHVYPLAVYNFNGQVTINVCGTPGKESMSMIGGSSILVPSDQWSCPEGPRIDVPCVVLDDWAQEHLKKPINFLWLDLEGVELQVLQASPQTLKSAQAIYVETNFKEFRYNMSQYSHLKNFLQSAGFMLVAHWYNADQGNALFVKNPKMNTSTKTTSIKPTK